VFKITEIPSKLVIDKMGFEACGKDKYSMLLHLYGNL
jgi:hypothetical protein